MTFALINSEIHIRHAYAKFDKKTPAKIIANNEHSPAIFPASVVNVALSEVAMMSMVSSTDETVTV